MSKFTNIFILLVIVTISSGTTPPIYKECPANEVYSECGNNSCQNSCKYPNVGKICKPACASGCICKENYLRNTKGVCVYYKNCDTCKPNEIFDLCGNTEVVNTCDEPNLTSTSPPDECNAGCICREGYVRNDKKECIKIEECVKKCPNPNEVFGDCGDMCPKTCANKDNFMPCPGRCNKNGGCVCRQGFVRGPDRKCIKPEDCPKCNGPNEFFSCGSPCDTECATLGEECPIVNVKCTERCYCKEGFARDSAGICIPVNNCPTRQCKDDPNAIIVPCGDPCPLTCENKDDPGPRPCPKICIKNGCKCKDGYVKGKDGKCTLAKNCPQISTPPLKCKENEIYDKCIDCPPEKTCHTYMTGLQVKCLPSDDCKPACKCKEGFVRNPKGKCVKPAECCTDPNAELIKCANPCNGGTCATPEFLPCKRKCFYYGCQCKKGYVKKSETDSTCILKSQCPYPPKI